MRIKRVVSTCPVNSKLKHIHSSNVIPTDTDFIKMPFTACIQGSRGSGKTVSVVTWVKHMERSGYVTRTFLISPTAETNKVFKNLSTLSDENVCSTPNMFQQALQNVYDHVKKSMKEHKDSLKYKQVFEKYKNNEPLTLLEESLLQQRQYSLPEIVPKPRDLLIMDDVQGSEVFTSRRQDLMVQMTIKHRHIPLSIVFLVQTFHGLP